MTSPRTLQHTILAGLLAVALALSGCSDDSGDNADTPSADDTTDAGAGTGSTGGANITPPPPAPTPVYINGTVQGVADCQLGPENALTGHKQSVPMEATNRTYTLDVIGGTESPVGFAICLVWAPGGETGNTGTVPADATDVTVYVDGGEGIMYSIMIE